MILFLVLLGLGLLAPIQAQVQLVVVREGEFKELSSTCVAVLNQQVNCDALLKPAGERSVSGIRHFYDVDELEKLCTSGCKRDLSNWQRRIAGACAGAYVKAGNGISVLVDSWPELYVEIYNSICLRDSDGGFCNAIIGSLAGINPFDQQPTSSIDPAMTCHNCMLSIMQTQLAMPLASGDMIKNAFTSLTKKCSATRFTLPPPPSMTFSSADPSTTTDTGDECNGSQYQLKPSDTCQSVSISQGISTIRLILANNIQAFCNEFPTAGTLCIPQDWKCTPYTVRERDTCSSIASAQKKRWSQIAAWNPELGRGCNKISRWVGYVICVSSPGGEWINPSPMPSPTSKSLGEDEDKFWLPVASLTPLDQMPMQSDSPEVGPDEDFSIPWAPGTRQDCAVYATAPITIDRSTGATSSSCADAAAQYGVAVDELIRWNPSLRAADGAGKQEAGPAASCTLQENLNYCVQVFEDVPADTTEYCVRRSMTRQGDSCRRFLSGHGLAMEKFVAWNPSVGEKCEKFALGKTYCVGVFHFRQPGIISSCNQFVVANVSSWTLNPCLIIETKFGLSHPRFVAWNPAVGEDCMGIQLNYDYCVSIPNYRPTYSTTTGVAKPTVT